MPETPPILETPALRRVITDPEQIRRGTADRLTSRLTIALWDRFDRSGIPFDMKAFRARLSAVVDRVIMNPSIPELAKDKFIQDVMGKGDLLADVSLDDISTLETRRAIESFGVETWELRDKTELEKQAYFLDKILSETIGKYIEPVAYSLEQAYAPKTFISGHEYTASLYGGLSTSLAALDGEYSLRVGDIVREIGSDRARLASGDLKREDLFREIAPRIVAEFSSRRKIPQSRHILDLVKNGNLTERSKLGVGTEAILPDGKTVDIVDVLLAYRKTFTIFQWSESEVRSVRERSVDTGRMSGIRDTIGMNALESEFRYLEEQDMSERIKKASFSDMVIMVTQIAQLAPVAGDIGGGFDGLASAYTGMNVQGAKLDALDRTLNAVFGVLGVTVAGGFISRSARAGYLAQLIRMIEPVGKYFPEKLREFVAAGGQIPEQARQVFETFARMMGWQPELAYARVRAGEGVSHTGAPRSRETARVSGGESGVSGRGLEAWKDTARDLRALGDAEYLANTKTLRIRSAHGVSAQEVERNIIEMTLESRAQRIELTPDMSVEMRRTISNLLARNHPLLEIIRLTPGKDVVNVNYGGTKAFNAIFWAQAYDDFLATFKSIVHARSPEGIRIPRDDYKNTTASADNGIELISAIFWGLTPTERAKMLDAVIVAHREKIVTLAKAKGWSIEQTEHELRRIFSFEFGIARVADGADARGAMSAFYEAEMRSRGIVPREGQAFERAHEAVAERIFAIEREFAARYGSQKFTHDGHTFSMMVTLPDGQKIIHPDLIQLVRKWEEWVVDPAVFESVKQWISAINGFDFIAPFVDFERDLALAHQINDGLRSGFFDPEVLLKNYKGTYTVAAYEALSKWKQGAHIFIDVVGMGLLNFASFRCLAVRYLSGEADAAELISAGGDVTKRFIDLVSAIRESYPNAIISLGGDEVRIFIPGMSERDMARVLSDITRAMQKSDLKGRVSHAVNPTGSVRDVLYVLDGITSVNKAIETLLPDYRVTHVDLHGLSKADVLSAIRTPGARPFFASLRGNRATCDLFLPWWHRIRLEVTPSEWWLYRFDFYS